MCIAVWLWRSHPVHDLLLLFNRDEYFERPTRHAQWWDRGENAPGAAASQIFAGKDERAGGTWLGCNRHGKVAFLTNFREPTPATSPPLSRGELPIRFLEGNMNPLEYAEQISKNANQYGGYNLILADIFSRSMVYITNRLNGEFAPAVQVVPPGLHVLSNGNLNDPWPKALRLRKGFEEITGSYDRDEIHLTQIVEELMTDTARAERTVLPDTGVDPDWEYSLSSIFVDTESEHGRFGTRSMAAMSIKAESEVIFYERYLDGTAWKETLSEFSIAKAM